MTARRIGYDTECLVCEEAIHAGDIVIIEPGIGAWHSDEDPPRNLDLYRRERERGAFKRTRSKPRRQRRAE